MLVIVSDLLLADGSAGDHNLKPQVYVDFLDQISAAHAKVREHAPQSRVEIVYLGNIFDMRRTHYWFEQGEHKPWRHHGAVDKKTIMRPPGNAEYLQRSVMLFNRIMTHENVAPIKGILGDKLADRFGGIEPFRLYIPGDADRLINMSDALRERVVDFLGLELGRGGWNPAYRFPSSWVDREHGVFMRHGHEWDVYSFEGDPSAPVDYDNIPMSDLINTELFARITYEASLLQPGGGLDAAALANFQQKVQQIDNVRPASSIVKWLARHFTDASQKKLLATCIERAVANFKNQEYVDWWLSASGHDSMFTPFDEADRIESLLAGLQNVWLGKLDAALSLYDKFSSYDPYARYIDRAAGEEVLNKPDSNVQYVVYGHTHHAEHVPLGLYGDGAQRRMVHYLNVGSMRPTHTVSRDGRDFFVSETLDFAIFYRPEERPGAEASTFELRHLTRTRV